VRISELTDDAAASALPAAFMHQHMPGHALEDLALLVSAGILDRGAAIEALLYLHHFHLLPIYRTKRIGKAKHIRQSSEEKRTRKDKGEEENHRAKENEKKKDHTKEKQIKEADQSYQGKGKRRRGPHHANRRNGGSHEGIEA
jgi:hypothetical protein